VRIAVDSTALLGQATGVGVFTRALVDQLSRRPEHEVVAFAISWRGRRDLFDLVPKGVQSVTRPLPARPARMLWKRFSWPRIELWTGPVDLVHGPNYVVPPARATRVVTVHDLTTVRFPELCTADTLEYPALVRRAIEDGAWVHTDSAFVADEVRSHFGAAPERVVPVHLGVDEIPDVEPRLGQQRAGAERYVLALGTVEPRKDYPGLVRAFEQIADDDPELYLVIAGPAGWGSRDLDETLERSRVRRRIRRTGWISSHDRAALLRGATALVHAATYEGFGLPPLEAMKVDVPTLVTRAGAVPEIVGDAALVVDVGDTDALAEGLLSITSDEALRAGLVERGRRRVAQFTWKRCVDGLLDLYRQAFAASP
jgi:glycosyltransferase involved in cell wall biosynthesis